MIQVFHKISLIYTLVLFLSSAHNEQGKPIPHLHNNCAVQFTLFPTTCFQNDCPFMTVTFTETFLWLKMFLASLNCGPVVTLTWDTASPKTIQDNGSISCKSNPSRISQVWCWSNLTF